MIRKLLVISLLILMTASTCRVYALEIFQIERPTFIAAVDQRVENMTTNGNASVGLGTHVRAYMEPEEYIGTDNVRLNVSMTACARDGITYECAPSEMGWIDLAVYQDFGHVGDEWGARVSFPESFWFRFYGGDYKKVWISSNGYLSFEADPVFNSFTAPTTWPSRSAPDGIIAAIWADLIIDSSARIIAGDYIDLAANSRHSLSRGIMSSRNGLQTARD